MPKSQIIKVKIRFLRYNTNTMVHFDEEEQQKRLRELRGDEEESLVAMLAQDKYATDYVDLSSQPIDNDAIRLLPEKQARELGVGPYKLIGKKVLVAVLSPTADGALEAKRIIEGNGFSVTFVMASHKSIEKVSRCAMRCCCR